MVGRIRRRIFGLLAACGAIGIALGLVSPVFAQGRTVVVLPTTGIVDGVMAGYLSEGIGRAQQDGAEAVIVKLNTPGGSLSSMNDIVGTLLESPVPTIVWVAPAGGYAASAGTFITLAANIALMAPGTSIGAASPVGGQGEDIPGTLGEKVKNDAIAKIRSIAEARGRNVAWAISTVAEAKSYPASEAVAAGAVDGIASSLDEVLAFANGRQVQVGGRLVTLDLTGATAQELAMNPFQAFIRLLSDPNIAFLLFSVGSLGLVYELINPNFVTGILGGLAIILAFIGFGSLPLNVGGLILIVLALVLFGLETTVTSHGLLAFGGVVCFALGASALYTAPGDPFGPIVSVATPLIVVMTVTAAAFMILVVYAAIRTRQMVGSPGLAGAALGPGASGIVRRPLEPLGSIYAGGEEWTARTVDERPLDRGTPVKVVGVEGLTVLVEPDQQPSEA
ncbi:MAG TPA: nodulation protein NfeD [Candidatus Limnocylindria bacterium]|nr:nodulation protein NfeD [Candidatus Limnocylindria bacterium]